MKREQQQAIYACDDHGYVFVHHDDYDFSKLTPCVVATERKGRSQDTRSWNNCIIMADTETSKKDPTIIGRNHVVAWTISCRANGCNLFTLYGHRPDTVVDTMLKIHDVLPGERTVFFFHNMPYDYTFLRRFFFKAWGYPEKILNVKAHYPLFMDFENGIQLRDSLMLAQRGLDKWAKDMDVKHQKAVGKWDYEKIRNQDEDFTPDELEYIEHDTLAGIECIDKTMINLHKHIYSLPFTATGIPRNETRIRGKGHRPKDLFERVVPSWHEQQILERVFHGGYTHANRYFIEQTITGNITCYDIASSYPFRMLADKFPMEKFSPIKGVCTIEKIIKSADRYAYFFKLVMIKPQLKDPFEPMPVLQYSKTEHTINPILDNGRILGAAFVEIWICEQDMILIDKQYKAEKMFAAEIEYARKDYLPDWYRDYVYECFQDKTQLKGGDPVAYAMAKAKVNSLYGMMVQKPVKEEIEEVYDASDENGKQIYDVIEGQNLEEMYEKWKEKKTTILAYQWGTWVTAYAQRALFDLGDCVADDGIWLYSDTDSVYATKWDKRKLNAYNKRCQKRLKEAGYDAVLHNSREYWLGVAELDGEFSEFKTTGAKRYCKREDGKLKITVAGVPKLGAACLNDDIENFKTGALFLGSVTGKKTHTYFYNEIYTDEKGNLTGDSIDLSPCDYLLDATDVIPNWDLLFQDEIEIQMVDYEGEVY